jgi:hypothetical protein
MVTFAKWIVAAMFAGFAWLFTVYTVEYLRPYKKITIRVRK